MEWPIRWPPRSLPCSEERYQPYQEGRKGRARRHFRVSLSLELRWRFTHSKVRLALTYPAGRARPKLNEAMAAAAVKFVTRDHKESMPFLDGDSKPGSVFPPTTTTIRLAFEAAKSWPDIPLALTWRAGPSGKTTLKLFKIVGPV